MFVPCSGDLLPPSDSCGRVGRWEWLRKICRLWLGSVPKALICGLCMWPPCVVPEQHVLEELERQAVLVYTPSRKVNGKRVVCYDDRYIVKVAYEKDGIIVSNDNYRDLQSENPEWKWFIEQRLLMFSFVNDRYGCWGPHTGLGDGGKPLPCLGKAGLGSTDKPSPAELT